jgi:hypothetical protein
MPCYTVKFGESTAILCGRGRGLPKPCIHCGDVSSALCDFPVWIGRTPKGRKKKKTCDAPLCEACAQKGENPKYDFCREHFPLAQAAHERRLAKKETTSSRHSAEPVAEPVEA